MPQTKREIDAILNAADMRPRHRFGQNFMVEPSLVRIIADAGDIKTGEHVIEVGPGTGTLTDELLERGAHVLAVEIDRDLAAAARERYDGRVEIIEADAMAGKHALHPQLLEAAAHGAKLVANLPYNIASPLVIELLIAGSPLLAFTVQKEVADRLRATPADGKAYGPLSVVAQSLADVEVLRTIPPTAFFPRPKIDSALVRLCRNVRVEGDLAAFGRFVQTLFGQRRKSIRHPLKAGIGGGAEAALQAAGLNGSERAGDLDPPTVRALFAAAQPL